MSVDKRSTYYGRYGFVSAEDITQFFDIVASCNGDFVIYVFNKTLRMKNEGINYNAKIKQEKRRGLEMYLNLTDPSMIKVL